MLNFRISRKQDTTKTFRDLKFLNDKVKILNFQKFLKVKLEGAQFLVDKNINSSYEFFQNCFNKTIDEYVPVRICTAKDCSSAGWASKEIKKAISSRSRLYKEWKCNKTNETKSKKNYYYNKFNNCIGDSRQVFKISNEIIGKCPRSGNVPLLKNGDLGIDKNQEIANHLNDHFAKISSKLLLHYQVIAESLMRLIRNIIYHDQWSYTK